MLPCYSPAATPSNAFRIRSPASRSSLASERRGGSKVVLCLVLALIVGTASFSTGLLSFDSIMGVVRSADPYALANMGPNGGTSTKEPLIVLSTGGGLWNTGVWSGWGMGNSATLNWAAAGVVVDKKCPYKCTITNDQRRIDDADMVVMELVNHLKFLGEDRAAKTEIAWPSRRASGRPLVANFFMEPSTQFTDYTVSPALKAHVDLSLSPSQGSDLPVTTICTWGNAETDFLAPAPPKQQGHAIAYFNEHGIAPQYKDFIQEFIAIMGPEKIHAYGHLSNRPMPIEAGTSNLPPFASIVAAFCGMSRDPLAVLRSWS